MALLIAGCILYICMRLPPQPPRTTSLEEIDRYKDLCSSSIEDCVKLIEALVVPVFSSLTLCIGYFVGRSGKRDE